MKVKKDDNLEMACASPGTVSSGLGWAHIFMAQKHYQDQFQLLMGTSVWPGTLNLNVANDDLTNYIALRLKSGIDTLDASEELIRDAESLDVSQIDAHRIRGVSLLEMACHLAVRPRSKQNLCFGGVTVECAVLIPDLTRHYDVVEIISAKFLREHFSLVDGDRVVIELI